MPGARFLLLLAGLAAAFRDSSIDDAEELSSAEVAAVARQLLHHVRLHLKEGVKDEERNALRTTAVVSGLERHGVPLEKQLEWFALAKFGLIGGGELQEGRSSLAEMHKPVKTRVEEFLENTEEEVNLEAVNAYSSIYLNLASLDEAKRGKSSSEPLSKRDPEAYRRSLLTRKPEEIKKWFSAVGKTVEKYRTSMSLSKAKPAKDTSVEKLNELLEGLLVLQGKIGDINREIGAWQDVVWGAVTTAAPKEGRAKRIFGFVKTLIKDTSTRWTKLGELCWKAFAWKARRAEEACNIQHSDNELDAMKEEKMKSGEDMASLLMGKSSSIDSVLEEEMAKANKVLEKAEKLGPEQEEKLGLAVAALRKAGQELEKEVETGTLSAEDVDELDEHIGSLEGAACNAKEWSLAQKLRSLVTKVRNLNDNTMPLVAFRGLGGAATILGGGYEEMYDFWNREVGYTSWGAAQVGFSVASVGIGGYTGIGWKGYKLDWNLEDCMGGSLFMALGVDLPIPMPIPLGQFSLGGSLGIEADETTEPWTMVPGGVHGFSIGWGLSVGLQLPVPLSYDYGRTVYKLFSSECFETVQDMLESIWIPKCKTCESHAEALAIGGLRTAIKAGAFPVLSDLMFSMMAVRVDKMRREGVGVELCPEGERKSTEVCAKGKYNPDLDETLRCSTSSTKFRNNFEHLSSLVVARIQAVVVTLRELEQSFLDLMLTVDEAAQSNPEVFKSGEWRELVNKFKEEDVGCLSAPRERTLNLAFGRTVRLVPRFERQEGLEDLDKEDLKKRCQSLPECAARLPKFGKSGKSKLVRKLSTAYDAAAAGENPYGSCAKSKQCQDENKRCSCEDLDIRLVDKGRKFDKECPGSIGHCTCKPGLCWSKEGCKPDKFNAESVDVTEMQDAVMEWFVSRNIELGSYAMSFKEIMSYEKMDGLD